MFDSSVPDGADRATTPGRLAGNPLDSPPHTPRQSSPQTPPQITPESAPRDPHDAAADDPLLDASAPNASVLDVSAAGVAAALASDPLDRREIRPVLEASVPTSAQELIGIRQALAHMGPADTEAEAIDRIRALEELKAACAAAQARQTHTLDTLRRAAEAARGIPAERRGRGLAGEIGLARRVSPHQGSRILRAARALATDLPHTLAALTQGVIGEEKAGVVHRETEWLPSGTDRRHVDAAVAERLPFLGRQQLASEARHLAIGQDPVAAADHFEQAVAERRVTFRATSHGMATLSATIPLVQAAACHRALAATAASAMALGDAQDRTPAQVMADTFVERLTGQADADATPIEVHLVMTDGALLGTDHTPARVPGHGSLPAALARKILTDTDASATGKPETKAEARAEAEVFLRRLYVAPESGHLVAMDSRRRTFPALLRRMVILRDGRCRTPYCDAQIKHLDHATPHAAGGQTSWANASGLCVRCNHTKENPGWAHAAGPDHLEVTTPTGHRYAHPAPPLLGTGAPAARPPGPPPEHRRIPGVIPLHLSTGQLTGLLETGLLGAA